MPTLTPIDYDPFYEATGADKQSFQPTAKLIAKTLFDVAPLPFKPSIAALNNLSGMKDAFIEGVNKSGAAGLKSMGEALENMYVPEGAVSYNDAGEYLDKDGKVLKSQYRPNILPWTRGEGGTPEFAMPAMADIMNTLGGPGGLGAGPSLRPALKYMDKIYKAKQGEQHLDAIPAELRATFEKQAMSGEDISNFNFGFINHKGHFLQREDALKYAIDHGILDPNDAKYGTLVTTMLNKSGGEGKLASTFFSALEDSLSKINQNKASGDQWLGTLSNAKGVKGEEIEWTGLKDFLAGKKNVTKQEIEDYLKENKVELNDVWKSDTNPYPYRTANAWESAIRRAESQNDWNEVDRLNRAWEHQQGTPAGTEFGTTKYSKWQLPGGENYRELLMTLPETNNAAKLELNRVSQLMHQKNYNELSKASQENIDRLAMINQQFPVYRSSHWDEHNILAHMRMNDRTIDGKKSLHLEEIQSDWHQQGREKGYSSAKSKAEFDRLNKEFEDARSDLGAATEKKATELLGMSYQKYRQMYPAEKDEALKKLKEYRAKDPEYVALEKKVDELEKARNAVNTAGGVPDAPFKKTWHELALKRAIREAAENGYERLSWTPGEAQAARYDLSKQLKELQYLKHEDGTYEIAGITSKGDGFNHPDKVTAARLPDIVGKEMAEKIIKNEGKRNRGQPSNGGYFEGVDLKIGGEGMKGFYDQIIPKSVEKIAKEFGVKVQKSELNKKQYKIKTLTDKMHSVYDERGALMSDFATLKEAEEYVKKKNLEKGQPIFYIDIPDNMRKSVKEKGQPLFSGTPVLTPIDYEPEFEK